MKNTEVSVATAPQTYHIFIKAPADTIWDALARPEFTAKYFSGSRVETTAEVGTPFRYHSPDGASLWGDEVVLESDRPNKLVVGWRSLFNPDARDEPPSRVSWLFWPKLLHGASVRRSPATSRVVACCAMRRL